MNRIHKIRLLKGIRDGKLSRRVLLHPKTYIFTEKKSDIVYYEIDGKVLSKIEYDNICEQVESDNRHLKSLQLEELSSLIITIIYVKGKTIL